MFINNSSSRDDNCRNNFLVLDEGSVSVLMEALVQQRKILVLLSVNGKEIFKFKANNKNVNFITQFSLRSISNGFSATKSRENFFKRKCI